MRVMHIRHMRMNMGGRHMPVRMAVGAGARRIVDMGMVTVVVPMRMFMIERHVRMFMGMALRKMQDHTGQHQRRARTKPDRGAARIEREGDTRPDERREREHRAGARSTELALRKQIKAQAEAVANRANGEQGGRRFQRRKRLAERHRKPAGGQHTQDPMALP